jgi:hypothetical protein
MKGLRSSNFPAGAAPCVRILLLFLLVFGLTPAPILVSAGPSIQPFTPGSVPVSANPSIQPFTLASSSGPTDPHPAQFPPEQIAERARWEEFLATAAIVRTQHLTVDQGVTEPWKLTLEKDGVTRNALWKNPSGTQWGFLESWKFEIAAYRLDKLLGIDMVPPTVEKRFRGSVGSCQLWIEDTDLLKTKLEEGLDPEVLETPNWKRMSYIQQLFDNLVGNEDRHMGNILITPDIRSILIDHSRTFRTTADFTEKIPFSAERFEGQEVMRELPRALVEKVRALDEEMISDAVGKYLTKKEIRAVLSRRDLALAEIDRLVAKYGEENVLY